MTPIRVLASGLSVVKVLLPIMLLTCGAYAADSCQQASKPDELIKTITDAEHKGKISTEVLRLMLPCRGTPVTASRLIAALTAGFSSEQSDLIFSAFRVDRLSLLDLERIITLPLPEKYTSGLFGTTPVVEITAADLLASSLPANIDQLRMIAGHCSLSLSEAELQSLLEGKGRTGVAVFLESSMKGVTVKNERTLRLLRQSPGRSKIMEKLRLGDAQLWAVGLKYGLPLSELAVLQGPSEVSVLEMFRLCQKQGVADSVTLNFLSRLQSHWRALSDADICNGGFSSEQIDKLVPRLNHPALKLSPGCVASLKARGVADDTIVSLTNRMDNASPEEANLSARHIEHVGIPMPPEITVSATGDPLDKVFNTSSHQGYQGLSSGHGSGYASDDSSDSGNGVYRTGGAVLQPTLIFKEEAIYSQEALKAKLEGTVLLSIVIDSIGLPHQIQVVRPLGLGLDEKAIEAVMKWRFRPALKGGKAVAVQAQVEVNFRLLADPTIGNRQVPIIDASTDLHVEILQVQWINTAFGPRGFGKGNVSGTQPRQGFDFTFSCSVPFLPTDGGGYYPATWKKPASKLVIVTSKIGNPHKHEKCELNVSLQPYTFQLRSSALQTVPLR